MLKLKSQVEQAYSGIFSTSQSGNIPCIIVDQFQELGRFAALRFIEWACENPEGVVSLPTGKTPEFFIWWTRHILDSWNERETRDMMGKRGLHKTTRPDLRGLHFVQIDDFYPIDPSQHNSFYYFINRFYLNNLGFDPNKAMLINSEEIPLCNGAGYRAIFPDYTIDLSLRHREAGSRSEEMQQKSIFMIDNWCMEYESKIREKGGIGFFLGGIGPDGHIAFNTRGSDHHSVTRLCPTNYETQAAAAGDLGGIEISAKRNVITIGLGTIAYNPDVVPIIFAAGEAKARIIREAVELPPDVRHPASKLQSLENARFYLTKGAAKLLADQKEMYFKKGGWDLNKSISALLEYCQAKDIYPHKLPAEEIVPVPGMDGTNANEKPLVNVKDTVQEVKDRLFRGTEKISGKTILHTGPHHDDIMLGIMPMVNRQLRNPGNSVHFAVLTSGFTAISNKFLVKSLRRTLELIMAGEIQMIEYPDFFEKGYLFKWDKDVNHFLNKLAKRDEEGRERGLCHRITRCLVKIYQMGSCGELTVRINEIIEKLEGYYEGAKNSEDIQRLKGMIREFEEELVWAHSGKLVEDIHHLRLGFYKGDIFTEQPEMKRDVEPVLDLLRKINPDIISVTMDPEGSGPDTHFKVLQVIAEAIREWGREKDLSALRIHAYRNVWYRFHPSEANVYVPVSLNSMAVMQNSFRQCYLSQVDASFPSPELNGPFCDLAQKIWVEQFMEIQLLLGKDFFYQNNLPLLRATHGLIFYRDLNMEQFMKEARDLQKMMD